MAIENLSSRHSPHKSWGWEEWIVNNDLYCGKRLHFTRQFGHTSLHFHMKKHETMYVEKGVFHIKTVDQTSIERVYHTLVPGDSLTIEPGTVHQIEAFVLDETGEAVLVEFSTHHEDSDSYRVER